MMKGCGSASRRGWPQWEPDRVRSCSQCFPQPCKLEQGRGMGSVCRGEPKGLQLKQG